MNDHLNELKEKISEEINHRTYSPLLFFIFTAFLIEHHEIALYLLDSNLNSTEKISSLNTYWIKSGSVSSPLSHGVLIFSIWCVIHPASALIWDLVKRGISWFKKTIIHRIPVIPEAHYEALKNEYIEERNKLYVEHSEMAARVEALKIQLDKREDELYGKNNKITSMRDQFSKEKAAYSNRCKSKIRELVRDHQAKLKEQQKLASNAANECNLALNEKKQIEKNFLEFKLTVYDKGNWAEDSRIFKDTGFRWRFSFGYLSPNIEKMIFNMFHEDEVKVEKKPSSEFSFVWVKDAKEASKSPASEMYRKSIDYLTVRDLYEKPEN